MRNVTRRNRNIGTVKQGHVENTCAPAVILEAFNLAEYLTHSRKLSIDARDEFDRLQQDGHVFIADRRGYRAKLTRETVRATQLYRTLPHEFGHYVHYRQTVKNPDPGSELAEIPEDERRTYYYDGIPGAEHEKFAHAYADRLRDALHARGIIPFDSINEQRKAGGWRGICFE